jgi:hypothetical protein
MVTEYAKTENTIPKDTRSLEAAGTERWLDRVLNAFSEQSGAANDGTAMG